MPSMLCQGWPARTVECGRSDGISLLRLGYKRPQLSSWAVLWDKPAAASSGHPSSLWEGKKMRPPATASEELRLACNY